LFCLTLGWSGARIAQCRSDVPASGKYGHQEKLTPCASLLAYNRGAERPAREKTAPPDGRSRCQ
jgi:hypothetical protein